MSNLTYLNDASVLHNLKQRYYAKLIYVSEREKVHVNCSTQSNPGLGMENITSDVTTHNIRKL